MAISYITTDLECDSERNLSALAAEFGNSIIIHLNDWVGDVYRVSVGLADTDTTAADAVSFYCSLLEKLTGESKALWEGCTRRVVDLAFEGGTEPESQTFQLPEAVVRQAATLGLSIAVTTKAERTQIDHEPRDTTSIYLNNNSLSNPASCR